MLVLVKPKMLVGLPTGCRVNFTDSQDS